MKICRWTTVFSLMVIGCAAAALAGDLVVDGVVATTGGWYEFADGSIQSSAAYPRWKQVAIVDGHGRGDYTDPLGALSSLAAWCGTPSQSNPCLVKILPGYYDIGSITLWTLPYLDIEGSGRDVTFIGSASSFAVIIVANHSELRSLTVINEGDGGSPKGISIEGARLGPRVTDVDIVVSGDNDFNTGLELNASDPIIDSIGVYVTGGQVAEGIVVVKSDATLLQNIDVRVSTPSFVHATGIDFSEDSAAVLKNARIHVSDSVMCYGIKSDNSWPQIKDVTIEVAAGADGRGFEARGGTATLTDSSIVVSGGTSTHGVTTLESGTSVLRDVRVTAEWGVSTNRGVWTSSGAVTLEHVGVTTRGGQRAYSIDNANDSDATLNDVTVVASHGADSNRGIFNHFDAQITATDLIVEVAGVSGSNGYGVLNQESALLTADNLAVRTFGGTGNYGVLNANDGGTVTIDRSTVTGVNSSVRNDNDSADFFVGTSKLVGPVSTHLTCFGNYDASYGGVVCP